MKYFNTQQAAADETDLLVNNADIQEVDDLQEDDFSEALREDLQEGTNGTGKADSVQYIPIFETLKILLSKEGILIYHIEQQNTITVSEWQGIL